MTYFTPYIDEKGMHIPTYPDIRDWLVGRMKSIFGADIYLDNDSQDYQMISAFALMLYDIQQGLLLTYNNAAPSYAVGAALDRLVALNGIRRIAATQSTCDVTLTGTNGTVIRSGVVQDVHGYYWDLPESVTIEYNGSVTVKAVCRTAGAITAAAEEISIISTPTRGWDAVTNAAPATPGTAVETDIALRARQKTSTANPSNTVFEGIVGAVSNLDGVTRCRAYENDTGEEVDGLPAHSITLVVEGGDADEIANTIRLHKTPGCYTYGGEDTEYEEEIEIEADEYGDTSTIRFARPKPVAVEVSVTIAALDGYTSAAAEAIRDNIYAKLSSMGIGESLYIPNLNGPILNALASPPDFYVTDLTANETGESPSSTFITIGKTEVLSIDPEDITVELAEEETEPGGGSET